MTEELKEIIEMLNEMEDEINGPYSTADITNWCINYKNLSYEEYLKLEKEETKMMKNDKNFVVKRIGKDYVFKRFIEALSFSKDVEKETGNKVAVLQEEIEVNSKYDLEKGELIMNQNDVNNEGLINPETSVEAAKTKWITIPRAVLGTEIEHKDKNDKPHKYTFVNLPKDDNNKESFLILSKQIQQHPFIKSLCNIPISEYGLNLSHSIKESVPPLAIGSDGEKYGPTFKWVRDDQVNHLTQEEAINYLTNIYKNINNKETQYMLLPKDACHKVKSDESMFKGQIQVKMPKYLSEHKGYNFAEASFIVNKVYELTDEKLKNVLAVQCSPNAKFRVYCTDNRYIDMPAKELCEYNKEDYAKYKEQAKENGSNLEKEDTPNKFAEATAEVMNSDIEDTLEADCAKIVEGMAQKEATKDENSLESVNTNELVENEDEGNEIN